MIPPETLEELQGSLATTHIVDMLQFLNASAKTGELLLQPPSGDQEARAYPVKGNLVHVVAGSLAGMEALIAAKFDPPALQNGLNLFAPPDPLTQNQCSMQLNDCSRAASHFSKLT